MVRPRLLDLFCGAGGCAKGYHDAGFEVVGVDAQFQVNYPYRFVQWDALRANPSRFQVVHASPPCQAYSATRTLTRRDHPDLLGSVRDMLQRAEKPYIIENVEGAPMVDPVLVCGAAFNLGAWCRGGVWRSLRRHRLFESNLPITGTGCHCPPGVPVIGVYGHGSAGTRFMRGYQGTAAEREEAMGIDWAYSYEMAQMIPPRYTSFLGSQIMELIK